MIVSKCRLQATFQCFFVNDQLMSTLLVLEDILFSNAATYTNSSIQFNDHSMLYLSMYNIQKLFKFFAPKFY